MKKQGKKLLGLVLAAGLVVQPFAGMGWQNAGAQSTVAEAAVTVVNGTIRDIYTDKAMYQPGDTVQVTIETEHVAGGSVKLVPRHLDAAAGEPVVVNFSGTAPVTVNWTAPVTDFQGYLLEAYLYDAQGQLMDTEAVGVNVSSTWVKFPIYGYLHDFGASVDTEGLIEQMAKYHINGIEYYDWHYRHHEPFPATSTGENMGVWSDWLGRSIYGDTVKSYIQAAKANGMASMAYDMIYAFTDDLLKSNPSVNDWRIKFASGENQGKYFNYDMLPGYDRENDTLYFVNPLNQDWQAYFFAQLKRMLKETGFDGYHGDTVGDWGAMTDINGNPLGYEDGQPIYVVADTYTQFLNACKDAIGDAYLSFNPVGAKGIQKVNVSKTDVLYTEFWPWDISRYNTNYENYYAIAREIEDSMNDSKAQSIDGLGKSLLVKAYINYQCEGGTVNDPTALLLEAVAFAAGGARLELGNGEHMLTNEYYPSDQVPMSETLKPRVRNMYDFAVAYENLLRDGQHTTGNKVVVDRYSRSSDAAANTIWTYTRTDGEKEILHLINLLGTDNQWRDLDRTKSAPFAVKNVKTRYYYTNEVNSIYLASPDQYDGRSCSLQFVKGEDADGRYVEFTVPSLEYWDMIYMSAETGETLEIEDAANDAEEETVLDSFTVEAEEAVLTPAGGTPVIGKDPQASAGQYVHDIGLEQGYATITVPEGITKGIYTLEIVYSSGTNGKLSVTIDGTEHELNYKVTDWNWKFVPETLSLKGIELSGGETIVLHDATDSCWSWLDCIHFNLNKVIPVGPTSGQFTLEAETAVLTANGGTPAVESNENASAGQYVHDIGLEQGYATITVPEDVKQGTYTLGIVYSSGTNGEVSVSINGEEQILAYEMTDGGWSFVPEVITLDSVKLRGGDEIVIHDARNSCWIWVDCIRFELTLAAEEDPDWGRFSLEGEEAVLIPNGGTPVIGTDEEASGGQYVHDIGLHQGYAVLKVPESIIPGTYVLEIVYSSGTNGTVAVTVDGERHTVRYSMTDGSWSFKPQTIFLKGIELSGGEEIVIQDAADNCWMWLDRIDFRLSREVAVEPDETETEPVIETETETETEPVIETETETETEPVIETETESETETVPETQPVAKPFTFTDVPRTSWYYFVVKEANELGVMTGYSDNTFRPNDTMNRAMVVTVLHRMAGYPRAAYKALFSDVPSGQYFTTPVMWAAQNAVVNGYADGTFHPNANVTREQLATMLMNFAKAQGLNVSARVDLSSYQDTAQISSYAKTGLSWAIASGIMSGTKAGELQPKREATRAEGAKMLLNFYKMLEAAKK